MRKFDYLKLIDISLNKKVRQTIAKINSYREKQECCLENNSVELIEKMKTAKTESIKHSNAIEGIYTSDARLKQLIAKEIEPMNKDEEEIAGYSHVLEIINDSYENIEITKNNILTLHKQLYLHSQVNFKGRFKTCDNEIMEIDEKGTKTIRFKPVSCFETETWFEEMIRAFKEALECKVQPLLLIPVFIHDFLCIHPFDDGNGRTSRLISLLLLYQFGYFVGKYISIERIIDEGRNAYYKALQNSSEKWYEGSNDEMPFVEYMLEVILKAYEECDNVIKG